MGRLFYELRAEKEKKKGDEEAKRREEEIEADRCL